MNSENEGHKRTQFLNATLKKVAKANVPNGMSIIIFFSSLLLFGFDAVTLFSFGTLLVEKTHSTQFNKN